MSVTYDGDCGPSTLSYSSSVFTLTGVPSTPNPPGGSSCRKELTTWSIRRGGGSDRRPDGFVGLRDGRGLFFLQLKGFIFGVRDPDLSIGRR